MAADRSSNLLQNSMIAIISPDKRLVAELSALVSGQFPEAMTVEVGQYPERKLYEEMASNPPAALFLDLVTSRDKGMAQLQACRATLPTVPAVVVLGENSPEQILQCVRQGASEFLIRPVTPDQIQTAFKRILQSAKASAQSSGRAKIVATIPAKGACGATTLATNLPFYWKKAGYEKVLLSDLDPCTGTVPFILRIKSQYSFLDALTREEPLDSSVWKGLVTNRKGVDVLLSPEQPVDLSHSASELATLLEFCRHAYELVVADCGTAHGGWSTSLAKLADEILLVTTNELTSLRAAQRVLSNYDRQGIDRAKVKLIVNRYNTEIGLNQDAIESALHFDVFQVVPNDTDSVETALVAAEPVSPSGDIGKSLAQLAEKIAPRKAPANEQKTKKSRPVSSLFGSLFSKAAK
jgi:pilus assembly protein CpaE